MAFPVGAILGGLDLIGGLVGAVKGKRENERLAAEQAEARQAANMQANATRHDSASSANIGLTQGLALRPPFGTPGVGMGTLSMFPPIGAQQQPQATPMFQMQQPGGQQQQPSPAPTFGGNFSPQLLEQGFNQPQAKQGQPQTAPVFNAIGAYLSNGRRG